MRKDIWLIVLAVLFAGCYSAKKASKQVARAQIEYPETVLNACPEPKTETRYLPGKETHTSDTVVIEGKRIPCPPVIINKDTVINWVDCPPSKVIHDTIRRTDTLFIQVENTALVKSLELQILSLTADRDKYKQKYEEANDKAKKRLWYLIGIGLAAAGYTVLKIKRILP